MPVYLASASCKPSPHSCLKAFLSSRHLHPYCGQSRAVVHRAVRRRVIAVGARSIHIHSEVVEIVLIGNLVCTERRVVTDAADGRRIM